MAHRLLKCLVAFTAQQVVLLPKPCRSASLAHEAFTKTQLAKQIVDNAQMELSRVKTEANLWQNVYQLADSELTPLAGLFLVFNALPIHTTACHHLKDSPTAQLVQRIHLPMALAQFLKRIAKLSVQLELIQKPG